MSEGTLRGRVVRALFLTTCLLIPVQSVFAVSASPESCEMVQPDGTRFQLQLRGDEFFSWEETSTGYAVKKDAADGFWKYARPASDQAAFVIIPDARVGSTDPAMNAVKKNAIPSMSVLRKQVQERRRTMHGEPVELAVPMAAPSGVPTKAEAETLLDPLIELPPETLPAKIAVSGTKTIKNLVILASFSDHWDAGTGTVLSTKGRVSVGEYSNLFNEVNHTTDSAVGSVRDYYKEVSYGKLTIDSVVTPWVVLPQNEAYYGANDAYGSDVNPKQMILDAINAADAAGFDFSQSDSDGDGWVDGLTVIHSGHGEEYSGNPANCIWSHQWTLSAVTTKDSVKMYNYHTEPALRNSTASTSIIRIGVICHEMGHFFGLPDLYDYSSTTYGVGYWGIMASGSWNGTDGKRPAHFCAWSKCMLGFVNPVPIHSLAGLTLPRVEDNAVVKILRDGTSTGEYFLVENRANTGFDNDANITPGILIYHVDSKSANNDLGTWAHPVVKIEEADGDNSLGAKASKSEAGDVWTSTSGLVGGFRDQTGNQSVNAMRYQASSDYNRTNHAPDYTYNLLTNFSAAGSNMTFDATTLKAGVVSQTVGSSDYTVSWPAASQATKYEIQEGVRVTLTNFSDGAEDEEAMYENWYMAGMVRRSSAGKRSGSYSYLIQRYDGTNWYSSVQAMTMQKSFKVKSTTVISFYLVSHLPTGNGTLKCQISNDGGGTWKTLGTYDGYINSWSSRSYNYAALNGQGINVEDVCSLRFVANFEYSSYYPSFPECGFALDDISITGMELAGYSDWATLNSNVTATSYGITGKTNGSYAYHVRAYANSLWQGYGPEGEITVDLPPTVTINQAVGQADPTNGAPIQFTVVFSESVADFATGDVTLGGTAPGTKTGTVSGSGTTYSVAVSGMTSNGTVNATIDAGQAHDVTGNGNTASSSTDNEVMYDVMGPTFGDIEASPALAKQDAAVTITFTVSETLAANPSVAVNAHAASFVSQLSNNYTYGYTIQASDVDGDAVMVISSTDPAGNPGSASNTTALAVDKTLPSCTITRVGESPTNATSVEFDVSFNEGVVEFTAADVDLTGTAPGKSITSFLTNAPGNYGVSVGNIGGTGTVTMAVAADRCTDAAGNLNTAGDPVSYVIIKSLAQVSLSGLSQTYDGTAKSATATTTPEGLTVEFTYDGSATAPTNVGNYAVTGTVNETLYEGWTNGMLVISKAAATVTLGDLAQAYDGTAKSVTATTTPEGLAVEFTYDGSATAPTNVGSYVVTGSVNEVNYAGSASDTLVISKAAATVTLGDLSHIYDGSAKSATVTTTPTGLSVSVTYNGSGSAPSAVGNYAVTGTVNEAVYQGSAVGTLEILSVTNVFETWLVNEQGQDLGDTNFWPEADVDGDGKTTWEEFLADTDPNLSNSVLALSGNYFIATQITNVTGQICISFPASTGRYYQLEYCTDLTNPVVGTTNLGWGVPGMVVTSDAPGAWYGMIRALLQAP